MNVRSLVRSFPPVARRDAKIQQLKDKLRRAYAQRDEARASLTEVERAAETEAQARTAAALETPSWRYKRAESLRRRTTARSWGYVDPVWKVNRKDTGYRFARSHGLDVPATLATYKTIDDIDWDGLPDQFVIKAAQGAGSHGVVPIKRQGDQVVDLLNVAHGPMEISDVLAYFRDKEANRQCSPHGVVEELLPSPYDDGRPIALDLKLYCFYGAVGMIMIRDVNGSRDMRDFRTRFVDPSGADLGEAIVGRAVDGTLPSPLHLKSVVEVGERVSAAIPTPFIRLDLYERRNGVVFGEITPRPGGNQTLRPDLDQEFGRLWEEAETRLRTEVIASGAANVRYGDGKG